MNTIQDELELAVKDKQTQAAELFEAAKLQSAMVFGLDDKPIAGIFFFHRSYHLFIG